MSALHQPIKIAAYKLVFWQFIVIAGLALALFFMRGMQSSLSALLGGLAYWLPNVFFIWRLFMRTSVQKAKQFMMVFLMGETAKLLLSAALFVLIAKYLPVDILSVLVGFVGAIFAFWIVSIFFLGRSGVNI